MMVELGRVGRGSAVVGFALSGFVDGILLHQILQWHHLLSLVPGQTLRDMRVQILADGAFHLVMYAIAVVGLWLLWRARVELDQPGSGRRVAGGLLLGFGGWNIVDVAFFHWILGIHRIRLNVPDPLRYDLVWFIGFGLLIAAAGLIVLRRGAGPGTGRFGAGAAAVALAAAIPVANMPTPGRDTLVIFRPGASLAQIINAVVASDGRIMLIDPDAHFAVIVLPEQASQRPLYRAGAVMVTRSPLLAGCLAYVTA